MLRLLQILLMDRFNLVVRRETKELQAYALVVDKGGLSSFTILEVLTVEHAQRPTDN